MAISRVSTNPVVPRNWRTLQNFEPHESKVAQRESFRGQLSDNRKSVEKAIAEESRAAMSGGVRPDVEREARALVSGTPFDETPVSDIKRIQREIKVLETAIAFLDVDIEKERQVAAREIAGDMVADDRRLVTGLIEATRAFLAAYDGLENHRAAFRTASGTSNFVVSPMQYIALNRRGADALRNDFPNFQNAAIPYVEEGK